MVGIVEGRDSNDVSVFGFESGTSKDDTLGPARELGKRGATEGGEPVPSVSVGEGNVGSHFIDIGFGMVIVAFKEREIERFGYVLCNGALSTTGWTCDQPYVVVFGFWLLILSVRDAIGHGF